MTTPMTLKEILSHYDKESLKHIAEGQNIVLRSRDTKAIMIEKIHEYISAPTVMENYFLCIDNEEWKALKKVRHTTTTFIDMEEMDFPVLYAGAYIAYADGLGIVIPDEIKEYFDKTNNMEFTQRRRRRYWLLQCINAAVVLYGIAPISTLVPLFNRRKKYKSNIQEIRQEIHQIPANIIDGLLRDDTLYALDLWPDDRGLLKAQGDKPFYIPTVKEIEELDASPLITSDYVANLLRFIDAHSEMDVIDQYQLLISVQNFLRNDYRMQYVVDTISEFGVSLKSEDDVHLLATILMTLSNHTRKVANRGFMPVELTSSNQKSSKIIDFNTWNHLN